MLRSLRFGLCLETFAKFLMILVSVSKNLVSEKKSRYRFRKIWYRKKSLGIGFGQNFGIVIQWYEVSSSGGGPICTFKGLFLFSRFPPLPTPHRYMFPRRPEEVVGGGL